MHISSQIINLTIKKYFPIILFLLVLYALIFLSLSRYQYKKADLGIQNGVYKGMYPYLVKARELLPTKTAPFLCKGDLQRIHTGLGKIWYERGRNIKSNKIDLYAAMEQSLEHYEKAIAINPHDILAVLGIAETMAALEFTFSDLFPGKENKYNAFPLFQRVCKVEPNGLASNYSAARYLYKKGLEKELFSQVLHTAKIFPSYGLLKKEAFNSSETRQAVEKGFDQAIKENIMPGTAYFSLSTLAEIDKDFLKSVGYYKRGMEFQKNGNPARNHLKLGSLLLKANKKEQSYREFIAALKKSPTFLKHLGTIYYRFKKQKDFKGFIEFATIANVNKITSDRLKLYLAQAQIEQKLIAPAKETLKTINAKSPNPKACYMLAMLAKKEKDWDTMELSIQKATVLQPGNAKYFNILADALIYQKKYKSAAEYLQKALANDPENKTYRKKLRKIRSYNN